MQKMTGEQIAEAVDKIIEEIPHQERKVMGAINWGDLSVREVRENKCIWPDPDDGVEIEVLIEEADPANSEFCEYLFNQFYKQFGIIVLFRTEW